MHQWWGDNVSEDVYERTFFKEGYADLSRGLQHRAARRPTPRAAWARRPVTRRSRRASSTRFNTTYNSHEREQLERRAVEPDEREPVRLADLHALRPLVHRAARDPRQRPTSTRPSKEIQTDLRRRLDHAAAADRDLQEVAAEPVPGLQEQARRVLQAVVGHAPTAARRRPATSRRSRAPAWPAPASTTPTAAARTYGVDVPGDAGATVPRDARADARRAGHVRHVHAGRGERPTRRPRRRPSSRRPATRR